MLYRSASDRVLVRRHGDNKVRDVDVTYQEETARHFGSLCRCCWSYSALFAPNVLLSGFPRLKLKQTETERDPSFSSEMDGEEDEFTSVHQSGTDTFFGSCKDNEATC